MLLLPGKRVRTFVSSTYHLRASTNENPAVMQLSNLSMRQQPRNAGPTRHVTTLQIVSAVWFKLSFTSSATRPKFHLERINHELFCEKSSVSFRFQLILSSYKLFRLNVNWSRCRLTKTESHTTVSMCFASCMMLYLRAVSRWLRVA